MYETYRELLPLTADVADGALTIGGVGMRELADTYGTPLFVFDEQHIVDAATRYRDAFAAYPGGVDVAYACKALTTTATLELMAELGIGADVASGGELAIALGAGIEAGRIVMHGNNKSRVELMAAVDAGVGLVVIDSEHELDVLEDVAREAGRIQPVLVRVTPGIEAETHHYIKTGHTGSKFGLDPDAATKVLVRAQASEWLAPQGVHVHLGSQLLDLRAWQMVTAWLAVYATQLRDVGIEVRVLDLGGGLGIAYTEHHRPPSIEQLAAEVIERTTKAWATTGLKLPRLLLEPGRSIVGRAAITLYEVGTVKDAGSLRYVNVDGGMSDNLRPMLYQAEYRCMLPERATDAPTDEYWIAGKHCESGDILIEDAPLPDPRPGDLLAVMCTGAYTHVMASNYNALLRPAVVHVRDGGHRLVVRRETIDDLMAREVGSLAQFGS
jgi:diaminopimelate decarboxylase